MNAAAVQNGQTQSECLSDISINIETLKNHNEIVNLKPFYRTGDRLLIIIILQLLIIWKIRLELIADAARRVSMNLWIIFVAQTNDWTKRWIIALIGVDLIFFFIVRFSENSHIHSRVVYHQFIHNSFIDLWFIFIPPKCNYILWTKCVQFPNDTDAICPPIRCVTINSIRFKWDVYLRWNGIIFKESESLRKCMGVPFPNRSIPPFVFLP